jgi:hypothetical protein
MGKVSAVSASGGEKVKKAPPPQVSVRTSDRGADLAFVVLFPAFFAIWAAFKCMAGYGRRYFEQ